MNKKIITSFLLVEIFTLITTVSAASPVYINAKYTINNSGAHNFGVDAFATIQDGINAVDQGGIISVARGTYVENLIIEKSLSLIGDGALAIKGASYNAPSINGGVSTSPATITVNGTSSTITVTIRNFNIVRSGNGINVLQNAVMTIDKNTISGYRKNGITFGPVLFPGYGGVSGTISNNIVIGAGPTNTISQNGIQVSENNTAVIINNKISSHIYTVSNSWWATGILIYRSEGISIAKNILNNNQAGVNIKEGSNNIINYNIINNNSSGKAGILVSDPDDTPHPSTTNIIKNNTISGGLTGIWTNYAYGNTYSNNIVSKTFGNGIYSWDSDNNIFSDNTISGIHSPTHNAWSVLIDGGDTVKTIGSDNNIISKNIIKNSDLGFHISNNSDNTVFSDNVFNDNKAITQGDMLTTSYKNISNISPSNATGLVLGATTINFQKNLGIGDNGDDVIYLQKILIKDGFLKTENLGYFGNLTEGALMKWQVKNNLPATGYFGEISRDFINSDK